jgi:hypothetical protein
VHAGDGAVTGEAHLHVLHLTAAVGQGQHVLGTGLHPLHGALQLARRGDRHHVLGGDAGLAAEAAAHVRGDDAHGLAGQPQHAAGEQVEEVRHLGGDVDGEVVAVSVVTRLDRDGVALHRHHGDALVHEPSAHDDVGAVERVHFGCLAHPGGEVAGDAVDLDRCTIGESRLGVGDGTERFVVDDHRLRRVDGLRLRCSCNHCHRLADEAHLVGRERRAGSGGVQCCAEGVEAREAEGRSVEDGDDAGHRLGFRHVDVHDAGVGVRGAHEDEVQHTVDGEVVDVPGESEQELGVLDPADLGTEQ